MVNSAEVLIAQNMPFSCSPKDLNHQIKVVHSPSPAPVPAKVTTPIPAAPVAEYLAKLPSVKVINKAGAKYSLAIRCGKVTLALNNPSDPTQRWARVDKWNNLKKDDQGCPVFQLVNKATGQALKHSIDAHHLVQLTPFDPNCLDESTLWSQPSSCDNFKPVRRANKTSLNLDVFGGQNGIREGIDIGLWGWNGGVNQLWSIISYPPAISDCLAKLQPVRVTNRAGTNYALAIRNGKVTLAPNNPADQLQRWVKFDMWSHPAKDDQGFPSFALINIATGQALKHATGAHHPVQLTLFNPKHRDESTLWSRTDTCDIYTAIRKANKTSLNLDAFGGQNCVYEGIDIGLWEWTQGVNQLWSIVQN